MTRNRQTLLIIILVMISMVGGVLLDRYFVRNDASVFASDVRESSTTAGLTNPLLECRELPEGITLGERISLQSGIEKLIADGLQKGTVTHAAVYYRDLNNGPWFGVNESEPFYPASLLKLPLAMSLFREAEVRPDILTGQFQYEKMQTSYEHDQVFQSSQASLENGKVYSVSDLVKIMLQESSNEAAILLSQILGFDHIAKIYSDLSIAPPREDADYQIDAHTFGSFFRMLYNATYLSRSNSEQLLSIMTHSAFRQGLEAGAPGITVSHKFGTREVEGIRLKQLHDCGIVYLPSNPFIMCVMTQGTDFTHMAEFIRDATSLVVNGISR